MRGQLITWYAVLCGYCQEQEELDMMTYDSARVEARRRGWSESRAFGWLCQACRTGNRRVKKPDHHVSLQSVGILAHKGAQKGITTKKD